MLRITFLFSVFLSATSLCAQNFGMEPKTVPQFISVLESRGDQVQTVASTFESGPNWEYTVLKRTKGDNVNYTLLRSLGSGTDEIVSTPQLLNILPQYVNEIPASVLGTQMVKVIIRENGGLEALNEKVEEQPNYLSGLTEFSKNLFLQNGVIFK